MQAIELVKRNTYLLDNNGKESNVEITFTGMCGNSYRFFWIENGLEQYFQCDTEFVEKHISENKKVSILNWEIAHENTELSDYMEASGVEDILDWFQGDPDQLRIKGETVLFVDIPVSKTHTIVVYLDGSYSVDEKLIEQKLTEFYSDNYKAYFNLLECLSNTMTSMTDGICYRGGEGYTYSLYSFAN